MHNRVEEGKEGGKVAEGNRVHNRQIISPSPNQTGEPIDLGDRTQHTTTEWNYFFYPFYYFRRDITKKTSQLHQITGQDSEKYETNILFKGKS